MEVISAPICLSIQKWANSSYFPDQLEMSQETESLLTSEKNWQVRRWYLTLLILQLCRVHSQSLENNLQSPKEKLATFLMPARLPCCKYTRPSFYCVQTPPTAKQNSSAETTLTPLPTLVSSLGKPAHVSLLQSEGLAPMPQISKILSLPVGPQVAVTTSPAAAPISAIQVQSESGIFKVRWLAFDLTWLILLPLGQIRALVDGTNCMGEAAGCLIVCNACFLLMSKMVMVSWY